MFLRERIEFGNSISWRTRLNLYSVAARDAESPRNRNEKPNVIFSRGIFYYSEGKRSNSRKMYEVYLPARSCSRTRNRRASFRMQILY